MVVTNDVAISVSRKFRNDAGRIAIDAGSRAAQQLSVAQPRSILQITFEEFATILVTEATKPSVSREVLNGNRLDPI
jgi:hypothetical protein